MKLTKRAIERARYDYKKEGGQYLWDDDLSGFGVRIYPSSKKSFLVTYRAKSKQRFHTLCQIGVLTVQEARKEAANLLASTRNGSDPSGERQKYWKSPKVSELAERYMEDHAIPNKKPSGIRGDRYLWDSHILPALGPRRVADIERSDISDLRMTLPPRTDPV